MVGRPVLEGAQSGGVSDHRSAEQPPTLLIAVRDHEGATDRLDQLLGRQRRRHVRAWRGQP